MAILTSAHHLDEAVAGLPVSGCPVAVELPEAELVVRLLALYGGVAERVAQRVGAREPLTVAAADCMTSLGVLAGLQRAGLSPGVVWLDAHGDFNTPETTESGYLGGMPLAIAVGHDALELGAGLGLRPVAEGQVLLAGARDLDAAEARLLGASEVQRVSIDELTAQTLPSGPLYLHVDIDVIDGSEVPDAMYPTPAGPSVAEVAVAIARVLDTGRVAAIGLACTWQPPALGGAAAREVIRRLGLAGGDAAAA